MTDSTFSIGPAGTEQDIGGAIELEFEVFSPFGTNNPPEIVRLQQEMFSEGFIVAKANGEVVGYSSSEKWKELRSPKMGEDPRKTHSWDGRVFCITTMAVREDMRGVGIGTAMLNHLIELAAAQGCHTMIVETPRTRTFYEKHGFQLLRMEKDKDLDVAVLTKAVDEE